MALEIPEATENARCPLCDGSAGIVVGEKGRFDMPVRNLCCETCGTVYVTPRPTAAAMAQYYRSTYREHYGRIGYTGAERPAWPGDPEHDNALETWHEQKAKNATLLTSPNVGARVLEIGCRRGKTLSLMRERCGILPFGVEPGEKDAEQARRDGIDCFTGQLEAYDPGALRFDQVQWFHVLEHLHEPLSALLKLRQMLAPRGKLLVEVPNVYAPYGLLEENFFQNVHLVSYSPNTLPALIRRAGFEVTRVVDAGALFVVATPSDDDSSQSLPLPFAPSLLATPEQDASWVATRLQSYAKLSKLMLLFKHQGPSPQLLGTLVRALGSPGFEPHLTTVCAFFIEQLLGRGQTEDALLLTLAVAQGPHPVELRQQFRGFAERLGATPDLLAATH
jgi:SAM-dependent methyltransferase